MGQVAIVRQELVQGERREEPTNEIRYTTVDIEAQSPPEKVIPVNREQD